MLYYFTFFPSLLSILLLLLYFSQSPPDSSHIPFLTPLYSYGTHGLQSLTHQVGSEVEVKLRPFCLGVVLPSEAHDQIFVFCLTVAGFLLWSALSDKRMGL
jgi:hypothetical protein